MRNTRELSNQAEAEIAQLRADGYAVSDADVVAINAICWEIESPENRQQLARGKPVSVGGVWLWPLTIAAAQWFDEIGCNYRAPEIALAYAMANGRGDIELATEEQVETWGRKLKCTSAELTCAIAAIINQDESADSGTQTKAEDKRTSCGELVALMHLTHGGTPEMWERQVSIGYVFDLLNLAAQQHRADKKSNVLKDRANYALAKLCHEIQARGKAGNDGN
jgi:hypothetical protein